MICINTASALISSSCLKQFHNQSAYEDEASILLYRHRLVLVDIPDSKSQLLLSTTAILTRGQLLVFLLLSLGLFKVTDKFRMPDFRVALPSTLFCLEIGIVAVLRLFAGNFRVYTPTSRDYMSNALPGDPEPAYVGGLLGVKAIADSLNPWDLLQSTGRAMRWLVSGRRRRHMDNSYDLARRTSSTTKRTVEPASIERDTLLATSRSTLPASMPPTQSSRA